MRHWQLTPLDQTPGLVLREAAPPVPARGQLRLRMLAASLNYRDLLVLRRTYAARPDYAPIIPLSDGVGIVDAVGSGVERVKVGERVASTFMPGWIDGEFSPEKAASALGGGRVDGVLGEYVVVPAEGLVRVPAHLSDEEAATLPCAAVTAWYALFEGNRILPGDTVLAIGSGGVSLFVLQFARMAGARVVATTGSADKIARLRELGAEAVWDSRSNADWAQAVTAWTGGRGVDLAVDVAGPDTFNRTLQAVRVGGAVSLMGVLSGVEGPVSTGSILMKQIRVQGTNVGSRAMFERMNRAIEANGLRPVVDRVFAFEEAEEALRYLESGRHLGKVCIRIGAR
ncbi:MAG: NAD(P)-dependent alcohol dehydrogenase [Opitutaceae bacterium]|nr:NAD(P)-dependent alcohol dehydrogenase [Opitutaceae bacterium]